MPKMSDSVIFSVSHPNLTSEDIYQQIIGRLSGIDLVWLRERAFMLHWIVQLSFLLIWLNLFYSQNPDNHELRPGDRIADLSTSLASIRMVSGQ